LIKRKGTFKLGYKRQNQLHGQDLKPDKDKKKVVVGEGGGEKEKKECVTIKEGQPYACGQFVSGGIQIVRNSISRRPSGEKFVNG